MKPSKLIRHLNGKHGQYKDMPRVFVERKAKELSSSQAEMKATIAVDKKNCRDHYELC